MSTYQLKYNREYHFNVGFLSINTIGVELREFRLYFCSFMLKLKIMNYYLLV